ncbi:MAG: CehA/McbA family metallohydrolase, partial [Pseudomonadota bacterium]
MFPKILLMLLLSFTWPAGILYAGEWYRGDLHGHSTHSDGKNTVAEILTYAQDHHFDYLALTDHDTSSLGKLPLWKDPNYPILGKAKGIVTLYGVEWTSPKGHANIFFPLPVDYAPLWKLNQEKKAKEAAEYVQKLGGIFSINHPLIEANRQPWKYADFTMTDFMEVWNFTYRYPSQNDVVMSTLWDYSLLKGRRIVGIGGSDAHELSGKKALFGTYGNPTTWIFAREKSSQGLLQGLKEGRVSLSYAPN